MEAIHTIQLFKKSNIQEGEVLDIMYAHTTHTHKYTGFMYSTGL